MPTDVLTDVNWHLLPLSTYEVAPRSAGKFLEGIFSKSWCLAGRQPLVEKNASKPMKSTENMRAM